MKECGLYSAFAKKGRIGLRAASLALIVGMAGAARAGLYNVQVTVVNNTGGVVNDIHLVFTGTGGTIANRVVVAPGGGAILPSVGNEFNASFNNLANGGTFTGTFTVRFPGIQFSSGYWTFHPVNVGPVNDGDVTIRSSPVPGPAAALGFAALAVRRRRRA